MHTSQTSTTVTITKVTGGFIVTRGIGIIKSVHTENTDMLERICDLFYLNRGTPKLIKISEVTRTKKKPRK